MYCPECGTENSDRASYCGNCGYVLKESKSTQLSQDHIPSYLGWAIAVTLLCAWIFGIVAIVYAVKVGEKLRMKDYAGAREASRKAKNWCWVSFGATIAIISIAVMIALFAVTCS